MCANYYRKAVATWKCHVNNEPRKYNHWSVKKAYVCLSFYYCIRNMTCRASHLLFGAWKAFVRYMHVQQQGIH